MDFDQTTEALFSMLLEEETGMDPDKLIQLAAAEPSLLHYGNSRFMRHSPAHIRRMPANGPSAALVSLMASEFRDDLRHYGAKISLSNA